MRRTEGVGLALALAVLIALLFVPATTLLAQSQPPAQSLLISARQASTWSDGPDSIVQLDGPVTITLDRTTLSAQNAVVWVKDARGGQVGEQSITVALLGDAQVQQPEIKRSGDQLIVTGRVNGPIRITADNRLARDLRDTAIYRDADLLRREGQRPQPIPSPAGAAAAGAIAVAASPFPATTPTTVPTSNPYGAGSTTRPARQPIHFSADVTENLTASDGMMAVALTGHVAITRNQANGAYLEMQCERAVVFTTLHNLREVGKLENVNSVEDAVTAAYLESDVRISMTPAQAAKGEQRLEANRVYYEFATDRAILTDAVIHSFDPQRNIPAIVRAQPSGN